MLCRAPVSFLFGTFIVALAGLQNVPQSVSLSTKQLNPAKCHKDDPLWQFASKEIYANRKELLAKKATLTQAELAKYILEKGEGSAKEIALTFDDGPHPNYTLQLLAILKKAKVKATFFVIGHMVEKYPNLVQQISQQGHEVANHTFSHVTLTNLDVDSVETEYKATNEVLHRITGKRVRYCRPPGGDFSLPVLQAAASLNLTTVLWTDDPGDYANPGDQVLLRREIGKLSPGGIILLHDGSQNTIDTLSTFIAAARAKGYKFVSLDQLRNGG